MCTKTSLSRYYTLCFCVKQYNYHLLIYSQPSVVRHFTNWWHLSYFSWPTAFTRTFATSILWCYNFNRMIKWYDISRPTLYVVIRFVISLCLFDKGIKVKYFVKSEVFIEILKNIQTFCDVELMLYAIPEGVWALKIESLYTVCKYYGLRRRNISQKNSLHKTLYQICTVELNKERKIYCLKRSVKYVFVYLL